MDKPKVYKEWIDLLDVLASGKDDANVLESMRAGVLYWQVGVAERFMRAFLETLNFRMDQINKKLDKKLTNYKNENELVEALLQTRKQYNYLKEVVKIPALPEEQQKTLQEMIEKNELAIQNSFEKSAKADSSGKLLSIIRNNKITG